MTTKLKNNVLPLSVKGKKKLLAPLTKNSINNKNIPSARIRERETQKESEPKNDKLYTSREKFELDCDNDKKEDAIFLSKISEIAKFFYEVNAKDIYDFLKSINLIRYIDSFINDGFETKEDLMEIQEDYFEENKNFNKNQQKKILSKANEYLQEYKANNVKPNNTINEDINDVKFKIITETKDNKKMKTNLVETGVGGGDINEFLNSTDSFNRCWTCFNKLKDKNYIEIVYKDSIVKKIVRFCCNNCKNKFEENIYTTCDNCYIKYDKSKGDFIYKDYHFHSQNCLDDYVQNNFGNEENINDYNSNINLNEDIVYDPMNDF
jgi:hypothetical protein